MRDVVSQNKNLSEAGKKRIDTSPRVEKSINDSASVSSNNRQENTTENKQRINASSKTITSARPSYEGYINSSSAHISFNNVGYLNKSIQKNRFQQNPTQKAFDNKDAMLSSIKNMESSAIMKRHTEYNYSNVYSKGSSSQLIKNMIDYNNLI